MPVDGRIQMVYKDKLPGESMPDGNRSVIEEQSQEHTKLTMRQEPTQESG